MIKPTNLIAAGILSRNPANFFNVLVGKNEQFAGWLFHLRGTKLSSVQTYPFLYTLALPRLSWLFTPILLSGNLSKASINSTVGGGLQGGTWAQYKEAKVMIS
jgi:hypothetical protein